MEKAPNTEAVPSDHEVPQAEVHANHSHEQVGDAPMRTPDNNSAQQVAALREDILHTNNPKEGAPHGAEDSHIVAEVPPGRLGAFFKKMGKFIKGGFMLLGGLALIGASEAIKGMASFPEKISKWTGKGGGGGGGSHGGGSHAKASSHAAPSGGHGGGGHKKESGGGHGGHH